MKTQEQKVISLQRQLDQASRFKYGISWHCVKAEDDNEIAEVMVADELGEDCVAWEKAQELKADGYKVSVIHLKDINYNQNA